MHKVLEDYFKEKRKALANELGIPEEEIGKLHTEQRFDSHFQKYGKAMNELIAALAEEGKAKGDLVFRTRLKATIESLLLTYTPVEAQVQLLKEIEQNLPKLNKLFKK